MTLLLVCFLLIISSLREDNMISKGEVLEALTIYGRHLGKEEVSRLVISDQWSDAMTMVVLLLQHPDDQYFQSHLDDETRRTAVHEKVLLLQANLARA